MASGHGQHVTRQVSKWTSRLRRREQAEVHGPSVITYLGKGLFTIEVIKGTKVNKRLTNGRENK